MLDAKMVVNRTMNLTCDGVLDAEMVVNSRSTSWKHLKGLELVPMDATCWVSWWEGIETRCSTGSSWGPPSMHFLLSFTFVTFLILWPLSPSASSVSWYQSCHLCSGLAYEIYSGGGPSTYVYCVVCYRVIVAPYVRSVGHVFAYIYTLDDDSEHPMDYETSLFLNIFPSTMSLTCNGCFMLRC